MWQQVAFSKTAHFVVYAILFWCWWWSFGKVEQKTGRILAYKWWLIPVLCILFAFGDEAHQYFVPGRTARLHDVWLDSLGVLAAWLKSYRYI
jgi:VanZ family protein